ncbi:MAG: hypothetical protein ACMUJM_06485 [bacterium]
MILSQADGYTDAFYIRFTTHRQKSLIIGTSRAAQGLQPGVLNDVLGRDDFFNYSFTLAHSPYGPAYLDSIKKKLSPDSQNGIHIVTVDPWGISSTCKNPNDKFQFRELKSFISKMKIVNKKPNFDYLINNFDKNFANILIKDSRKFLHTNGWLEVTVKMDPEIVQRRINKKIQEYKNKVLPRYKFSNVRYEYLFKTIEFLKQHGRVFMVRLPIHPKMMDIERILMPDFNNKMQNIVVKSSIKYYDMTYMNSNFTYTDGNHLHKESGAQVSKIIAEWILKNTKVHNY